MYTEPRWLHDPPEDIRKTLGECEECGQELLTGDTVYETIMDSNSYYCSEECFVNKEMTERVLS